MQFFRIRSAATDHRGTKLMQVSDATTRRKPMRLRTLLPIAALFALTACGDDAANQTGSTNETSPPPASTPPTNPTSPSGTTPAR
jgi:hypothetical protein